MKHLVNAVKKITAGAIMYDKNDNDRSVNVGDKVLCIQDNPSISMDDKNVTIKKGQTGRVTHVGMHGSVNFKWDNGIETYEMANAELSEYVVLV